MLDITSRSNQNLSELPAAGSRFSSIYSRYFRGIPPLHKVIYILEISDILSESNAISKFGMINQNHFFLLIVRGSNLKDKNVTSEKHDWFQNKYKFRQLFVRCFSIYYLSRNHKRKWQKVCNLLANQSVGRSIF